MAFTDSFIRRPVLAICVNLAVLIAGYQAIHSLIVRQYPQSDVAVVTVRTIYTGASADLVRGFVTTPLERSIASADGIDYLESASKQNMSEIIAHLRLNFNVNDALTQIQAKVAQVRNELPPEAEAPTIDVENSDARIASMYLSFYSKNLDQNQITDYLVRVVQPQLSAIAGVQKADILGARTFAMRIWLKPDRLAAYNISPSQIREVLEANNFLAAVGNTKGTLISVNLIANTDLRTTADFKSLVVKREGDALVRLSDVADVVLGAEDYESEVRFDGAKAVFMGVWVLPNANTLDVIKRVRLVLPDIQREVPAGMKIGVPYDATEYIEDAIREVLTTLSETIIMVIIVIFLFIGSLRSVFVPVVAIPLSLIGGVALMQVFGFSVNLLTLLSIVLAVGLVVDDAIVMLENVERHIQGGEAPIPAAINAARELVGPVIAMTITLAAVYAPIGFQGGLTGTLFKEFAFTLAGAVVISGFVALTLSPMMSSRLVKKHSGENDFKGKVDHLFLLLRGVYGKLLQRSFRYRTSVLISAFTFLLLLPALYMFAAKELAPREDQGIIFGIVQADPQSSLDQTLKYTEAIQEVYSHVPEYQKSFQVTFPNSGFAGFLLKPWGQRTRTSEKVTEELWSKVAVIPGVRVIVTTPPPLPGGSDFPIELVISSTTDPEQIVEYADQLIQAAYASNKFMFADTDLKFDLPQSEVVVDRDKVAVLGLDMRRVATDLGVMTGGGYVNRFNIDGRSYKVIPQLKRAARINPEQLEALYVSGPNNHLVSLSTFAKIENSVQARQLNRFQQLNSAKIQGALAPGVSVDEGLKILEKKAAEILPKGYSVDYAGESRQLRKEQSAMTTTLILASILIFLVLAAQFESFRDPFIILFGSVPLALTGSMIFVFLDFTSLNIYSQVGLVTLVGLVAKNGILIVEFANSLQEKGKDKFAAVTEAAMTRLRPVLMTSVATVVGHLSLVFARGAGAAARNSIGIVLVSGMIIGTLFTLFLVPAIYTLIARKRVAISVDNQ